MQTDNLADGAKGYTVVRQTNNSYEKRPKIREQINANANKYKHRNCLYSWAKQVTDNFWIRLWQQDTNRWKVLDQNG